MEKLLRIPVYSLLLVLVYFVLVLILYKNFNAIHPDYKKIHFQDINFGNVTSSNEKEKCNVFEGRWIYDPKNSPFYHTSRCPFLGQQVNCRRNGRPDSEYEKWTWEPSGTCKETTWKFNGKEMLEKIRNKRVIMVGDSLIRNQWESLACLLYSSLPSSNKSRVEADDSVYKIFETKEYNGSVEFFWSPYLVAQVTDGDGILNLHELVSSTSQWKGADVMVFNTGSWWDHHGSKLQALDAKGQNVSEIDTSEALGIAMETWSSWIDRHVDATKTKVFFRSISPDHKGDGSCYNQTQPIASNETYEAEYPRELSRIVEVKIGMMKTPVTYLNVTELSKYRRDGHPSVYKICKGCKSKSDCSHWCLPGVPDTWNVLMFGLI